MRSDNDLATDPEYATTGSPHHIQELDLTISSSLHTSKSIKNSAQNFSFTMPARNISAFPGRLLFQAMRLRHTVTDLTKYIPLSSQLFHIVSTNLRSFTSLEFRIFRNVLSISKATNACALITGVLVSKVSLSFSCFQFVRMFYTANSLVSRQPSLVSGSAPCFLCVRSVTLAIFRLVSHFYSSFPLFYR